jgi:hypothetical protein
VADTHDDRDRARRGCAERNPELPKDQARIEQASVAELKAWSERVIDAPTLADVFDGAH